jgi:hypothetical protein
MQTEAQRQLEEQQEKQARALKAMQRAQKLLATHVSMQQQQQGASSSGSSGGGQRRAAGSSAASSGTSSGASTHREALAATATAAEGQAGAAPVADAADLEAAVQVAQLRLVLRSMLQELKALDAQNPGECGVCSRGRGVVGCTIAVKRVLAMQLRCICAATALT